MQPRPSGCPPGGLSPVVLKTLQQGLLKSDIYSTGTACFRLQQLEEHDISACVNTSKWAFWSVRNLLPLGDQKYEHVGDRSFLEDCLD